MTVENKMDAIDEDKYGTWAVNIAPDEFAFFYDQDTAEAYAYASLTGKDGIANALLGLAVARKTLNEMSD